MLLYLYMILEIYHLHLHKMMHNVFRAQFTEMTLVLLLLEGLLRLRVRRRMTSHKSLCILVRPPARLKSFHVSVRVEKALAHWVRSITRQNRFMNGFSNGF